MREVEAELDAIPTGLPAPMRPVRRAAVRMRGAVECVAAGYVGTPGEGRSDYVNVSSLELVGPRAHPAWSMQIQFGKDAVSSVSFTRKEAPYVGGTHSSGKPGHEGWSAAFSEDGRRMDVRAVLPGPAGTPPLDLACRVWWPPPRAPEPVPGEIKALLEKHTNLVARKFSTWDFGRERDPECASVIVETDEQARGVLPALRQALPPGWVAFVGSRRWLDHPDLEGRELVVAPGHGWADMLRAARLDPVNAGLKTESVVRWLAEYERTMGIDVLGACTDSLNFTLRGGPEDEARFVDDLLQLCGDLRNGPRDDVEQMVESGTISLWWD
jgi:hypothetical protein